MPRSTVGRFHKQLKKLQGTRKRIDSLFEKKKIRRQDVNFAYEALFLKAVKEFETFLERLFLDLMTAKLTRFRGRRIVIRASVNSPKSLEALIAFGKKYAEWIPYDRTTERAKIFFGKSNPFSKLDGTKVDIIKKIVAVRNAIAHSSSHAKATFDHLVVGNKNLLPHERTPAGFLQTVYSAQSKQTHFELNVLQLGAIATWMSDSCT